MKHKKHIIITLWWVLFITIVSLLFVAQRWKNNDKCAGLNISILHNNDVKYINEREIEKLVNFNGLITEKALNKINLKILELELKQNGWIKEVEIFFNSNRFLQIDIVPRQPIARLINIDGNAVLIDSNAQQLPLSNNTISRLLVITGFKANSLKLSHIDSVLLIDVKNIANFIKNDSLCNIQVAQMHINSNNTFDLYPAFGDHKIIFGNAENLVQKFERVKLFYQKIFISAGVNTYEKVDVRFQNQIVATRKGAFIRLNDSTLINQNLLDTSINMSNNGL